MLRLARAVAVCRFGAMAQSAARPHLQTAVSIGRQPVREFTAMLSPSIKPGISLSSLTKHLILPTKTESIVPVRTVTKCSIRKVKRKSVKAVWQRFKRLHWGGWIRTRCGRHKKMHKKSSNLKHRLRQHVFVNATQSQLLDKMVTKFWKRPKYYIDDMYEPYHERTFYKASTKPMPYPEKPLSKYVPLAKLAKQFD